MNQHTIAVPTNPPPFDVVPDVVYIGELRDFVSVPAVTFPDGHVEPPFKVSRYLCSKGVDGQVVIDAAQTPWVNINYAAARAAAAAGGFSLLTERQALAIALNIAGVAANWTGGGVGVKSLFQGLRNGDAGSPQPGNVVPAAADEQCWFYLSNGERIHSAAGNAYSWVFDNVQGNAGGFVDRAFAADSLSITCAPYASLERGVGWYPPDGRDWSGRALVRGGCFSSAGNAGVFNLDYGWPDGAYDNVGFRVTQ